VVDWETFSAAQAPLLDYCQFIDEGRVDDFVDIFTPDAILDEGATPTRGHEAIRALASAVVSRYRRTSHHLSNVRIEPLDEGRLRATSYVYAWHEPAAPGDDLHIWARYIDELRFDGGRWRIARRRLELHGARGLKNDPGFAWAPRAGRAPEGT